MSNNKSNDNNRYTEEDSHMIEGRNSVLEAYRAGKTVDKLYVQNGLKDGVISSILRDAKKKDTIVNFVSKEKHFDQMSKTRKHQGVMAICSAYQYSDIEDIFKNAEEKGEQPFIFILDEIEDPHNLGAIIRTANLCGAHGVIIPQKKSSMGLPLPLSRQRYCRCYKLYGPVAKVTNLLPRY